MKKILVRTKPKDSFTLVVSDSNGNIQTTIHSRIFEKVITIRPNGVLMMARHGQECKLHWRFSRYDGITMVVCRTERTCYSELSMIPGFYELIR